MAEKLKADAAAPKGIAEKDLKRVVKDIIRHKQNASENAGLAGKATSQAVEQYSLDPKALGIVVGLVKKNDLAKAMGTLRSIVDYADKAGLFDQIDAFDDVHEIFERISKRGKNVRPNHGVPSSKDETMGDLMGAAQTH